jgi:hypothetical protein
VITPHTTPGPEVEFAAMAGSRVTTRIARVGEGPTSPAGLRELTHPVVLDRALQTLRAKPIDVVGWRSTTLKRGHPRTGRSPTDQPGRVTNLTAEYI